MALRCKPTAKVLCSSGSHSAAVLRLNCECSYSKHLSFMIIEKSVLYIMQGLVWEERYVEVLGIK